MNNPLDVIKNEVEEIKTELAVAVETIIQEQIAKMALSRLMALHPDKAKYQTSLSDLD